MSLYVERWYPLALSAALAFGWWYLALPLPPEPKEFLGAALGLGAVLTGFIATAQAILMALPSDSIMGRLRASGYIGDLVAYIGEAMTAGMLFCVVSLAGFFLLSLPTPHSLYYSTGWFFLAMLALLSFTRVTRLMLKIMRH